MNIANSQGWMLLNNAPFVAGWNGNSAVDAITVESLGRKTEVLAVSHFGFGILTFRVGGLFCTEPGYDLFVTGPLNCIKDAIQPLTGVVETDWAPSTFTMNWKFTRPGTPVFFLDDEPFLYVFPSQKGLA